MISDFGNLIGVEIDSTSAIYPLLVVMCGVLVVQLVCSITGWLFYLAGWKK